MNQFTKWLQEGTREKRQSTEKVKEDHPRSNFSQVTNALRNNEEYITEVSEPIDVRRTRRLFLETFRTESRLLGALWKLAKLLLNSNVRVQSGTTPGTIRNSDRENQTRSEDCSENDPHPEVGTHINRSSPSVSSDHDTVLHTLKSYTKMDVVNKVSVS